MSATPSISFSHWPLLVYLIAVVSFQCLKIRAFTIVCAIPASNPKLSNFGSSISTDEYLVGLSQKDVDLLMHYYTERADFYGRRIQKFLIANRALFPELECGCDSDIKPHLDDSASCSVFLGGLRNRKIG